MESESIKNMSDAVRNENLAEFKTNFEAAMKEKLVTAIDNRRKEVSQELFKTNQED